jgi:16S rRNA (cytosine967-C5)-methyltransferase
MVESIIPLLKEGGKMVYSTCSIDDEENGQLVSKIIEKFSYLKKIDEVLLIPQDDRDGAYAALLG